jgi:hypothetical protein
LKTASLRSGNGSTLAVISTAGDLATTARAARNGHDNSPEACINQWI